MTKYNFNNPEIRYLGPPDYEISELDGLVFGSPTVGTTWVVAVDNTDESAKMFKRNAMHTDRPAERWLVAECKGVRLYFDGVKTFILTDKDVYPSEDTLRNLAEGKYAVFE